MRESGRIKVLTLIDQWHYGGSENRIMQLARSIDRRRFDLRVATFFSLDPDFERRYGSMREEYQSAGIEVTQLGLRRSPRSLTRKDPLRIARRAALLIGAVRRIVELVRREEFDIIDGHGSSGYLCGTLAACICGIPSVLTTYNVRERWSPRIVWAAAHQATLACASAVVTDSTAVANELRSWMLRKKHPRILVIPNGPPPPRAARPPDDVRRQLGLPAPGSARIIGQVATLLPGKGQHLLIDAMPDILTRHPDAFFLIVGFERADHPGYAAELRSRAERLGISERLAISSYQGPIGDVWQTIDIQAHPSMLDSLPNTVLEGMALGRPAVVAATAGIPTMVLDGETGIVVPPGNAAALARGINRLLDDPELARRFGDAAQQRYHDGYTDAHLARRMETVFSDLVLQRARP